MTSLWLDEAATEFEPAPPLEGDLSVDVCIVGGGYTGLWSAIFLKEAEPSLEVALIEAKSCGSGASGRNGGFVLTWWAKFRTLKELCGAEDAIRLAQASQDVVTTHLPEFCATHGINADLRSDGWLWAATTPAQINAWEGTVADLGSHGLEPFETLAPQEVSHRTGSNVHLAGVYEKTAATVQPAVLALGLRRVATELGVQIFEHSPMLRLEKPRRLRVTTPQGTVAADRVLLALNAWSVQLPELRRAIVVITSEMIASEPIGDRLREIGWTNGLAISDSRLMVNYYRTTRDGRIAFGKGGGTLSYGGRVQESFTPSDSRAAAVRRSFEITYPMLADVATPLSWSGPIDRSSTGLPFFGELRERPGVFFGAGFSGNGVGPSYLGGRILASLARGARNEWTETRLARGPIGRFPPEPVRYLGGHVVRAAVAQKESSEDRGRSPGRLTRLVAGMAPAGLVPVERHASRHASGDSGDVSGLGNGG